MRSLFEIDLENLIDIENFIDIKNSLNYEVSFVENRLINLVLRFSTILNV